MARQNGVFISGVLGPVIYKVVNNKQIIASKPAPGKIKQTAETKRASNTFGMASTFSAALRKTLAGQLLGNYDYYMVNRLNGKVSRILNASRDAKSKHYHFNSDSFQDLNGFEFNADSKVSSLISKAVAVDQIDNELVVSLPLLDIPKSFKFPHKSFQCTINISVALFRLKEGLMNDRPQTQSLVIDKHMLNVQPQQFVFSIPKGCLCLVTLFLVYETAINTGWETLNHKKFNPGCICKAFISAGESHVENPNTWRRIIKLK